MNERYIKLRQEYNTFSGNKNGEITTLQQKIDTLQRELKEKNKDVRKKIRNYSN
jgi:hypothetical protein